MRSGLDSHAKCHFHKGGVKYTVVHYGEVPKNLRFAELAKWTKKRYMIDITISLLNLGPYP